MRNYYGNDAIEEKFLDVFDATEGVALKAKEAWDAFGGMWSSKENVWK